MSYLLSNQEDILLCRAAMRIPSFMLAGPWRGALRARIDGLSAADIDRAVAGSAGHFPILICAKDEEQREIANLPIAFTRVEKLIFRTREELDRIAFVRAADLDMTGVAAEVRPELFAMSDQLREMPPTVDGALEALTFTDRLCGSIAAVAQLAAVQSGCIAQIGAMLAENDTTSLDASAALIAGLRGETSQAGDAILLSAAARAVLRAEAEKQHDPARIAAFLVEAVPQVAKEQLERAKQWQRWLAPRLDYSVPFTVADFADPDARGSVALRGMTLALFRSDVSELTNDPSNPTERLGASVSVVAAMLLGFRSGLSSLCWKFKASNGEWLGQLACVLDARVDQMQSLRQFFRFDRRRSGQSVKTTWAWAANGNVIGASIEQRPSLIKRVYDTLLASGFAVTENADGLIVRSEDETITVRLKAIALSNQQDEVTSSASPDDGKAVQESNVSLPTTAPEDSAEQRRRGVVKPVKKRASKKRAAGSAEPVLTSHTQRENVAAGDAAPESGVQARKKEAPLSKAMTGPKTSEAGSHSKSRRAKAKKSDAAEYAQGTLLPQHPPIDSPMGSAIEAGDEAYVGPATGEDAEMNQDHDSPT